MEPKISSVYRIASNNLRSNLRSTVTVDATLVHVFPANVVPDETLMRVYAAGPAGEPPPFNYYKAGDKERWVFKKHLNYADKGFMIITLPMYYHTIEELIDGNT